MRTPSAAVLGLIALSLPSHRALAAESYANCTAVVTSLPKTISTPGVWCIEKNLSTASVTTKAVTIAADNVTLECNDFSITGTAGASTAAIGIYGKDRLASTVRHCNVEGFHKGVYFQSTGIGGGHVVEDSSFNGNTQTGIRVEGDGSNVRRNTVFNTGGSTTAAPAWGIYTVGSVNVSDNTVDGVVPRVGSGGSAYGIYTSSNRDGAIDGNRVRGLAKDGAGKIYAVDNVNSGRVSMRDNDLFGDGSTGSTALTCVDASGRAKGNIIDGFAKAMVRCGDGGQNDISP